MQASTLSRKETKALKTLKAKLSDKGVPVLEMRLYGSKARGRSSRDSDIDVMIKVAKRTPVLESRIDDIVFDVNLEHEVFVSTIIFDEQELTTGPMRESPIYRAIQKEGIPF